MFCRSVSFATACWEKDWKLLLLDPTYLRVRQIAHHQFPFAERLLVINNVQDLNQVRQAAQAKVEEKALTRFVVADEIASEALSFFGLQRGDFVSDWIYYNALAPLVALYAAR